MVSRIVALLIFLPLSFLSQTSKICGNKMSPAQLQNHYAKVQSTNTLLPHDTCLNRELSIAFHIVLDSNNQAGVNGADINAGMDLINAEWKRICVSFKNCKTDYIPNYNYNQWRDDPDESTCFPNYCIENTINIFLVENIITPANAGGYAGQMAPSGCNRIVIQKGSMAGVIVHEMGHFFGLPHTWTDAGTDELVIRTNCYTNGDGFCDTESDPYPLGKGGANCDFQPGPKDANGNYYTPPVDNHMTYYSGCKCRFTQEQYNFMVYTFLTNGTQLH